MTLPLIPLALLAMSAQPKHVLKEITFERQPCFGRCPVYKVTITNQGAVTYHGGSFVERIGDYTATLYPGALDSLGLAFEKLGYWSFKPSYDAPMTDMSTQIITAVSDQGKKRVHQYGHQGPIELWACQTLIDGILADARDWKKVRKK